jgi:hypothetical protein
MSSPPSPLHQRFKIRVFAWSLIFLNKYPTEVDIIISYKGEYQQLQSYMSTKFNDYDTEPMKKYMITKAQNDNIILTEEDTKFEMRTLSLGFLEALEVAAELNKELRQTPSDNSAGGSIKKATKEKVLLPGKSKPNTVYLGARGGKYVKVNGKFVLLSKLK